MAKKIISILSLLGCITAFVSAWFTNNTTWYFTALGLLLTFIGTFVVGKAPSGHVVKQKGGAFSKNNQNVYFGNVNTGKDDKNE
ncbi:hypothetical protein [Dickeya dadantii]|uniref:hypothetical protein n=1 Tax=Dickeya dadantii TaxID=204038 RepID=UPI001268C4BB|nr:hypothetical protein [Dickeya dadantii]